MNSSKLSSAESTTQERSPAATPASSPPAALAQRLGNHYLQRLLQSRVLQAKLTVSDLGDAFEQEADRVADQVMRMPAHDDTSMTTSPVAVQRKCAMCEDELQRSEVSNDDSAPTVNAATEQAINSLLGRGHALPESVRSFMEPRFNADFSVVRIHTDAHAQRLARSVEAQAFTVGRNVVFGAGRYAPESDAGKRLLAHELTHVAQQGAAPARVDVRVHADAAAAASAAAIGAKAYTVDNHIVLDAGHADPESPSGLRLIAYELAHVIQQQRGGAAPEIGRDAAHERDADAATAAAVTGEGPVTVNVATGIGIARTPLDLTGPSPTPDLSAWSGRTPDLKGWSVEKLETTLQTIEKWSAAQTSTSPQTELADVAAAQIREESLRQGRGVTDEEIDAATDTSEVTEKKARRRKTFEVFETLEDIALRDQYQEILIRYPEDAAWRREFDLDTLQRIVEERFPGKHAWLDRQYFQQQLSAATWTWYQKLEFEKLKSDTNQWTLDEQGIALELLRKWFELRNEGRTSSNVRNILIRRFAQFYEQQLLEVDKQRMARCAPGSPDAPGYFERMHGRGNASDPCESWFANDSSHGPSVLNGFRSAMQIAARDEDVVPAIAVLHWVEEYRKLTNPERLKEAADAAEMVSGLAALGTPGGARRAVFEPPPRPKAPAAAAGVIPEPPVRAPGSGPSPDAIQGGGQSVSPPAGQLSVVGPDNAIALPYQGKTPPKPNPPPGSAMTSKLGTGQPANDNAPPIDQRQVAIAGSRGGGDPVMSRRTTPPDKPTVATKTGVGTGSKVDPDPGRTSTRTSTSEPAGTRVTNRKIASENDVDTHIEPARPKLESPPSSLAPDDVIWWERYQAYFDDRIQGMRDDFRTKGSTKRDPPLDFGSFRQRYTENPQLLDALRGRLNQGQTGRAIDVLTAGKAAQNLGLSRVPNPKPGEVVYPDFVFQRAKGGYSAVSHKSRVIAEDISPTDLARVVKNDIAEAIGKYHGTQYVRRRGLEVTGGTIQIDEIVLNYDTRGVPPKIRNVLSDSFTGSHQGVDVKIGFLPIGTK